MRYAATIILLFVVLSTLGFSQDAQLRQVKGRVIKSKDLPAVELEFGKDFKYVGGHKFVLYDVANAEQPFFVDADNEGRIQRM